MIFNDLLAARRQLKASYSSQYYSVNPTDGSFDRVVELLVAKLLAVTYSIQYSASIAVICEISKLTCHITPPLESLCARLWIKVLL